MTTRPLRETEVPWLRAIPADWDLRRLRTVAHVSTGARDTIDRVDDGAHPFFVRSQKVQRIGSYAFDGEAVLTAGDGAGVGKVFHYFNGKFDFHQRVYKFSNFRDVLGRFFFHYFRALLWNETSAGTAKSTVDSLRRPMLLNFPIAVPPVPEQRLIVRYLDHADLEIARAINAKRELIALLDERRRGISQELVTRGVQPPASTQPSGIEWLGDVPAHWEVRPAKSFYREADERSERGGEQLMSVSHLTGVTPRATKNVTMFMAVTYAGHKLCRKSDLVVNTMWAWMGALGVAPDTGIVSPAYAVYRPLSTSSLSPAYADLLLRSRPYIDEYTCRSTGIRSSRLRLYPDRFLTVPVVCPPPDEQGQIVTRVADATSGLEVAIAAALREVQLLQEYRTRLIVDVVTGRRDVRSEAAALPEVDLDELAAISVAVTDDDGEGDVEE